MNDLLDITDQYPAAFAGRRPPVPDEVETCQEWLADQDPADWLHSTAGSMKHHMDDYVRTASLMAAIVLAAWKVTESASGSLVVG